MKAYTKEELLEFKKLIESEAYKNFRKFFLDAVDAEIIQSVKNPRNGFNENYLSSLGNFDAILEHNEDNVEDLIDKIENPEQDEDENEDEIYY